MKRRLFTAVACLLVGCAVVPAAAQAQPVHTAQVHLEGNAIHYTAGLQASLTGWGGSFATAHASWGYSDYFQSVSGSCLIGFATNVDYDAATDTLRFDCFAVGRGSYSSSGPWPGPFYSAFFLGAVRVAVTAGGLNATATALSSPLIISLANPPNPGGWHGMWSYYQMTCTEVANCSMTLT